MKYREAYCYDSSPVNFDTSDAGTANVYIEEVLVWKQTKVGPTSAVAKKRLVILRQNLGHTAPWAMFSTLMLGLSWALSLLTAYWIIPFAFFLPLALRYAGHYLTLKIAINRAMRAR